LNEVLYDPEGPDSGREFVELINTGAVPVLLEGWTLLAGDGARSDLWREVWAGAPGDTIAPGGLFVIGGRDVPGADSRAELSLQNGPDGCALHRHGLVADLVGWGNHEFGCYYEGSPAADAPSGKSLSRRPDGFDTDVNAADLEPRPPSPGEPNAERRRLLFVDPGIALAPANPELGETVRIGLSVTNDGYGEAGVFDLSMEIAGAGGERHQLFHTASTVAPGDTADIETEWNPDTEGGFVLSAVLSFEGDSGRESETASAGVRVGAGPVVLNEIMFDPAAGGEWIEISNTSRDEVDLAGWSLEDRGGGRLCFAGPLSLRPGEFLVAAQDSALLLARFAGLDPAAVTQGYSGRWISLNNSAGSDGLADVIALLDATGLASDIAAYSGRVGGGGVSLERLRADVVGRRLDNWFSSAAADGATPGLANSARAVAPPAGGLLRVAPQVLSSGGGVPALVSYTLPFRPSKLRISVYRMDGREVSRIVDVSDGPVSGTVAWDGRGPGGERLDKGAYILVLSGSAGVERTVKAKAVLALR
jgi:hypothetical protein